MREEFSTVGSVVTFGRYEQGNGVEPIEWIVLDATETEALVISKYGLDCKPYNSFEVDTTWERCRLRSWLNGQFLNDAFTAEEQVHIVDSHLKNPHAYSIFVTHGGIETIDKIFLLSVDEAERYFKSDEDRQCVPSPYAIQNGAWIDVYDIEFFDEPPKDGDPIGEWWLRSTGYDNKKAAAVSYDGDVNAFGTTVVNNQVVVRPALWLDLRGIQATLSGKQTDERIVRKLREAAKKEAYLQRVRAFLEAEPKDEQHASKGFGRYPKQKGGEPEPIDWIVLCAREPHALVISKYGLDCRPYHAITDDVTWDRCALRSWLNGQFLNDAFTAQEQEHIVASHISNPYRPKTRLFGDAPGGTDTTDKIFLLSIDEALSCIGPDEDRKCVPTPYAIQNGAWLSDRDVTEGAEATGLWWLRSPAYMFDCATTVNSDGDLVNHGTNVGYSRVLVRPAFWLKLD